ncbi:MAG: LutC/YkgG family protein [Candidatus Sumerlaeaceae bacterium]
MTIKSVQEFQQKYESLSGHVQVVANVDEAVAAAVAIVKQYNAKCVALAKLPKVVQSALQALLEAAGIKCLVPPYPANEMPASIDGAQVGITGADFAIAETGSIVEFALNDATRLVSSLPRVHIAFVWTQDLVATLPDAGPLVRRQFEQNPANCVVSFISGPSRSGDIEMKLTLGVHGPEQSYVLVLNDPRPFSDRGFTNGNGLHE